MSWNLSQYKTEVEREDISYILFLKKTQTLSWSIMKAKINHINYLYGYHFLELNINLQYDNKISNLTPKFEPLPKPIRYISNKCAYIINVC